MALQLTGAYKRSSLANLQVRLPAHRHRRRPDRASTRRPSCSPTTSCRSRRRSSASRRWSRAFGETRVRGVVRRRGERDPRRVPARTAAPSAPSARARATEGREPRLPAAARRVGRRVARLPQEASPTRRPIASTTRRSRSASRRACASSRACRRSRRSPTRAARVKRDDASRSAGAATSSSCRRARCASPRARRPTRSTRRSTRARSSSTSAASSRRTRRRATPTARSTLTPDPNGFFTSYNSDGHTVSYYGDNHPRYAGSVVKAMASAKHGFRVVAELFGEAPRDAGAGSRRASSTWQALAARLDDELRATVVAVNRLTPTIVEVVVRAPFAAQQFHPGQFYRLQNFERERAARRRHAADDGGPRAHRRLDRSGARACFSLIVLEMGSSSRLCAALKPGEPVVVMGPTGTPTEIPEGETVLLAGGGLGNAVLFSIGKALRAAGCKVIYFAAYRKARGRLQDRRHRGGHRRDRLVDRRGAGDRRRGGRRIARSSATSCRRWSAYAERRARRAGGAARRRRSASSPSAPTA